ncbi:uncharacterized protein N7482_004660 [Penicillium canariense]|uniref:Early meiotic induction protein 1 n=1 Tax=Penicillium canariense TaxID=189055 RepID=A0A9W9I9D7_9EURO|nr:uncharacterized protein N7482_004660 [Penicillium canariense]KAJ5169066.1 hypothetical protein N7482_004660 [Penicillium canariense]
MGWWWSSSPQKDTSKDASSTIPNIPQPAPPIAPPARQLTPDEQADLEFSQILAELQRADAELSGSQKRGPESFNGSITAPTNPDTGAPPAQPASSIAPESLYADSMSCRTAFDYAFFCQSFGGQFVNVYRYGELRSCSEHWDNFWLCMKTRGWSDDLRRKAIRAHNQKKAIKYKTGPSSEDVWDVRLEPAKDSFQGDFAALEKEMKVEEELKQNAST